MRPHHVQHIITPTGSIPYAHNGYLRILDMQRHSQNEGKFGYIQITIECLFILLLHKCHNCKSFYILYMYVSS